MIVKLKSSVVIDMLHRPGDVLELDKKLARSLIKLNLAESLPETVAAPVVSEPDAALASDAEAKTQTKVAKAAPKQDKKEIAK